MISVKKLVSLLLICVLATSFFGCDPLYGHNEAKCAEAHLNFSLDGASLVETYTDRGYDGSVCYHVFSVPDGFGYKLNYSKWQFGEIPEEAMGILEASSRLNGESVISFPAVEGGVYYYDLFNDGENERFCLAVLDMENDILYYFFASGQGINYPRNK